MVGPAAGEASRGLQGSRAQGKIWGGLAQDSHPANLLQLGARTRPLKRRLKMWELSFTGFGLGLGVFPSSGKSMYIVYIWPLGWLGAGLCLLMYGRSVEWLYTSILHRLLPLYYPVRV